MPSTCSSHKPRGHSQATPGPGTHLQHSGKFHCVPSMASPCSQKQVASFHHEVTFPAPSPSHTSTPLHPAYAVLPAALWTGPALLCLESHCSSCCPILNLLTFYPSFKEQLKPHLSCEDVHGTRVTETRASKMKVSSFSLYTRPLTFETDTDKAFWNPHVCTHH